jgi:hypothetical protein
MIETNSPDPSSGETDEPKPEQVRLPPQGNGTPRPLQRPKPGRVPLFRR